jgi:hypothetical protein
MIVPYAASTSLRGYFISGFRLFLANALTMHTASKAKEDTHEVQITNSHRWGSRGHRCIVSNGICRHN